MAAHSINNGAIKMNATTKSRVYKGRCGWTMETSVELGNNRQLNVLTMKRHNGDLVTSASVGIHDGDFISHRVHQDFSKRLMSEKVRVTENRVILQHKSAIENLDDLIAEANEFYCTETA